MEERTNVVESKTILYAKYDFGELKLLQSNF